MDINDPKYNETLGYWMSNAGDRRQEVLTLARRMPSIEAMRRSPQLKDILENNSMIRARKQMMETINANKPADAQKLKKSLKR